MTADQEEPRFIPGLQEEWQAFAEGHRAFLERFEVLKLAANAAFKSSPPVKEEAPFVIYALVRQAAQDFLEILLLAANGYGLAAQKILRGMYERIVTARWLHTHPEEAVRFLELRRSREMTHMCSREMTHPWCAIATDPILRRTLGETDSELVS